MLLANEAFDRLLRVGHRHLQNIDDLPILFLDRNKVRQDLQSLVTEGRAWRGEVRLETDLGETKPMLVRADPVTAAPARILGFVFLFTDLTEQKAAEVARQRFQYSILDGHRRREVRLDSEADLLYQNLLSSIVGNAQLAALEITDSFDVSQIPDMLDSVQTSVEPDGEPPPGVVAPYQRRRERSPEVERSLNGRLNGLRHVNIRPENFAGLFRDHFNLVSAEIDAVERRHEVGFEAPVIANFRKLVKRQRLWTKRQRPAQKFLQDLSAAQVSCVPNISMRDEPQSAPLGCRPDTVRRSGGPGQGAPAPGAISSHRCSRGSPVSASTR